MSDNQVFSNKSLSMTVLMTPDKANFSGNVHGGEILKLMDQVAYACASRYCGKYVVTLSVDQVLFKEPIRVGDFVTFLANVNYVGNSSMEVGIKVIAEDLKHQSVRHTNTCYISMVAMEDGKPSKVPPLEMKDEEDRLRFTLGKKRKEDRLKKR
jgi:acyl-CoA hydrolase